MKKQFLFPLVVSVILTGLASAQSSGPGQSSGSAAADSAAAQQCQGWLNVFNAGGRANLLEFLGK